MIKAIGTIIIKTLKKKKWDLLSYIYVDIDIDRHLHTHTCIYYTYALVCVKQQVQTYKFFDYLIKSYVFYFKLIHIAQEDHQMTLFGFWQDKKRGAQNHSVGESAAGKS